MLLARPGERVLATELVASVTAGEEIPNEKARLRVTQRVRSAIAILRDAHPALASHLGTHLHTGKFCAYLPGPLAMEAWILD